MTALTHCREASFTRDEARWCPDSEVRNFEPEVRDPICGTVCANFGFGALVALP
jgi:hypothetical protein